MKRRLLSITLLLLCLATSAFAHPHAFVECAFAFVMDRDGLVGFKQRWVLDEMTTVSVMDVVDADRNGVLSAEEKIAIRDLSVESLLEYRYFTAARINGKDFVVREIAGFTAELKDGKLIYDFMVPCRVAAVPGKIQEIMAAVYDDSFYTYIAYVEEGAAAMDPTKDPLFVNREAPARPEDFKRFSSAVGLGKFTGKVPVRGDLERYKITSSVKDAPEMTYFYDQITPQAFTLSFELK